jgi:hypothetical protein
MFNTFAFNCFSVYCRYIYPFIHAFYTILKKKPKYIEPPLKGCGWNCLVYLDENGLYNEFYGSPVSKIAQYGVESCAKLWIVRSINGHYLYNNSAMTITDIVSSPLPQPEKSSVYFLTIVVIFDDGNNTLEIKLKKDEYIVGNRLLMPLHILRYMKHNGLTDKKLENYTIEIMDNSMNIFQINNRQCILLDKRTFRVVDVTPPL